MCPVRQTQVDPTSPDRLLGFDRLHHWMTWLRSLGSRDTDLSYSNLLSISQMGMPDDLMEAMILQMEREFIRVSDVDRAINNLQRFFQASRSPLSVATLFQRDQSVLPVILQLFSASQHCSELLIAQPDYFDFLRLTGGQPRNRAELMRDISEETEPFADPQRTSRALRRFKHRETLRIAYGDLVLGLPLETTTQQISHVADAICHAAYLSARRHCESKATPTSGETHNRIPMTILSMGKLGGSELNYSSDIDLVFLYGNPTGGLSTANDQRFFDNVGREFLKLLADASTGSPIYRVDMRLRPDGNTGPLTVSLNRMLNYYENRGRTWERQALLKARVTAGDDELGNTFLQQLEPWLYQKHLSRFQIESIQSLKRKIEQRAAEGGHDHNDVKTGRGGIRDIEFAIQFLQLLHAANQPSIRTGNTLKAIDQLQRSDCLTVQEATVLQKNYRLLRQVEHRLQLMFDLQTHRMPDDRWELRKLALRCDFGGDETGSALDHFLAEMANVRETNRRILDHLLHEAFPDRERSSALQSGQVDEVDLILDPDPDIDSINEVLKPYRMGAPEVVYRRLRELSQETSRFLSDQRCRHFFAAICRPLLERVAQTPNPAETLTELSRVADSLGNKGVLWELFSDNGPSMDLCVRLCSVAPYLTSILTSNPGMLDELMDSLLLDQLPSEEALRQQLRELLHAAEDPNPILHSFKHTMHLLVGARDVLGKESLAAKHRFLSDVAEVCLGEVMDFQYHQLVEKWGQPIGPDGRPMPWTVLALGKLGGKEPNYHSDLDLAFVYLQDGQTVGANPTSHQHFFGCLASEAVKALTKFGPLGRLFEVDCRLRPTGRGGVLAVSLPQLRKYFGTNRTANSPGNSQAQLWERQALCKARIIGGNAELQVQLQQWLVEVRNTGLARRRIAGEIYDTRRKMEQNAGQWNLKRGVSIF